MTAKNLWVGMPEFKQEKVTPYMKKKITFIDGSYLFARFETESDYSTFQFRCLKHNFTEITSQRTLLSQVTEQKITDKTKSIWFPFKSHWGGVKFKYKGSDTIKPMYPVYIVSKGRARNGITTKALNRMNVDHYIVVEHSEYEEYKNAVNANVIILPQSYLDNYDTCDSLGDSKSKGPGAARNFCLDHAKGNGFKRHWVMDDNLDAFHYLNENEKYEVECGSTLLAAEEFIDRYKNIPVAGLNYYSFCKKTDAVPPFILNTRIYSCLLIDNDIEYRWRGRYNEDTDLSLRVLKDGLCTLQFNAFLCGKVTTQRMSGGNSKEFYDDEGTLPKSQMLADLHPDVSKVVWRFNRWHHHVDYKPFKSNKLELLNESAEYAGFNQYGLVKVKR